MKEMSKESNRERQRRWRAKHLGYARLKSKNAQRRRRGKLEEMPIRNVVPNAIPNAQETHYASIEGFDEAPSEYKEQAEYWRRRMGYGQEERRTVEPDIAGFGKSQRTTEEERVDIELGKFIEKRRALEAVVGVEVEL